MTPEGFKFSVGSAGIKGPGIKDMALIFCQADAAAAATFTTNKVQAAHVKIGRRKIRSGRARAVLVNSGNANSCTGEAGARDALWLTAQAAGQLGVPEKYVYPCSTGIIGVRLPVRKMARELRKMTAAVGSAKLQDAARAIMTTDTYPKFISRKLRIGAKTGTVAGIAKGAGMIEPNMATMLAFIMTDVAVEPAALKAALGEAVEYSFNRITVDGDRSTNDTAMAMASGLLGNSPLKRTSKHFKAFKAVLSEIAYGLSWLIARDGEGATKLAEVTVKGARSEADAKRAALKVANSKLVKTALHGADPNWGRIMVALGSSGAAMKEEKTDIYINGIRVVRGGVSTGREKEARKGLRKKEVGIVADLRMGRARASVLTCDLTEEFVRFNSAYTS